LAELKIAESDVVLDGEAMLNPRDGVKKRNGFFNRHLENLGDILSLISDIESFSVVAFSLTNVALNKNVREKVHFDFCYAVSLARLTATALHIEGKPTGLISTNLSLWKLGEEVADEGKKPGVSRGV
jgi:hypothetical protein